MNLRELAKHLGLSQTTVSRALNGYPEVAEETRLRVLAAAERHNYRPNTRAKSLATGRSMTIAHVIPISDRHEMVNPVFADFIAGASEAYLPRGYDISLTVVSDSGQEQLYRDIAARRSADGVIVHAPKSRDPRIALLSELKLPFVVHGRSSEIDAPYSWVDVDNKRSFRRAAEFLADLGHRRIALINGLETMDFAVRRRAGFTEGLKARGIGIDPALMRSDEMTEGYGFEAARELLALKDPPTAFVTASTISAFGIRRAVEGAGLRMGRDISLITHDDDLSYFRNGGETAIFTALRSSVREAGRIAAATLIELIETPGKLSQTMLNTDFIVGESTGPRIRVPEQAGQPG
ncbi:LacI family DNA-binding transcriptional regulator [Ovoidimarina sediminis]|uniref:LacI family DNA-binding transcriptional regulator n=1 Tax=Ovoidimarina sediminis TaxID=3079856 RepID=UPI00290DC34C|nr:substrate-binding domain-containing protein [Rhodophyticola sp. MJ-SS7]MDU8945130.1 substrate-binding domain-containing protein [Rhodophyticola sp. MJ-SS7]